MVYNLKADDTLRVSYQIGLLCRKIYLINDEQNYQDVTFGEGGLSKTHEY